MSDSDKRLENGGAGTGAADQLLNGFEAGVAGIVDFKKRNRLARRIIDAVFPRWVTPNMVTIFRTLLIVPAVWLLVGEHYWPALLVFGLAALLDFVDGALSEIRNLKTKFGAFLDPLSDKVLVSGFLLAVLPKLPAVFIALTALVLIGAVGLTVARVVKLAVVQKATQGTIAAKPAGKIKMICEVASVIVIIGFGLGCGLFPAVVVGGITLGAAGVLGLMSLWSQIKG